MLKVIGILFLASVALMGTAVVAAGAYLWSGGIAVCRVDTPEVDLMLPVPTRLADVGLTAARFSAPLEELEEVRHEIEPWRPMIESLLDELGDIEGDRVLVSVKTPEETVVIERRDDAFHIAVDAPDARVEISYPVRALKRLSRKVAHLL